MSNKSISKSSRKVMNIGGLSLVQCVPVLVPHPLLTEKSQPGSLRPYCNSEGFEIAN